MNNKSRYRTALRVLAGVFLVSTLTMQGAHAASGDGSIVGSVQGAQGTAKGATVTARNVETGLKRTVKTDDEGNYRFPSLPPGRYNLEATLDGASLGSATDVPVGLGVATTAEIFGQPADLQTVTVSGTRVVSAVDVTSTEASTNITREQLELLPVERDLQSIALLAPGIQKGEFEGISFGGSSVAENTVYINGLNVTDFYKRIGSSSVPYSFYKEFQVKTGGYSVEFGRTTGGVINAVTRSGTNEFEFGTEVLWEPDFLQATASNQPQILAEYDEYERRHYNIYAGGPIMRDKLFFFALYEFRDYQKTNTNNSGNRINHGQDDDGFWGLKLDWQVSDNHLLELLAFSDENERVTDSFQFDGPAGTQGAYENTSFDNTGGTNGALTYTGYLREGLSMRVLLGGNEREGSLSSRNDIECARIRDLLPMGAGDVGCTATPNITARTDTREAARVDFDWELGDHRLRFGLDRETNTSEHEQFYPGPARLLYEVRRVTTPNLENGAPRPAGVTDFVRARQNEVFGEFETRNWAYYLEDNWQVTPNLLLNAGLRLEEFVNKDGEGNTYIEMKDSLAPRLGFSWDMKGDARSKLFGNAGRYFLPVANVINIKQAGAFLDARTWYVFNGWENFTHNGITRRRPILGPQVGSVDTSQGDGTVGDLRGEVDADMDPVYQDELILGFQSMIDDRWSWGVRGVYRTLHNAIDDMEISSTGIFCAGEPVGAGFVMANPGEPVTIFADTNCDDVNDSFVTIDTATAGWALFDDAGNYIGEQGYDRPTRKYRALELGIDRAWDRRWSLNATYTLSYSEGNAEGPVNSDTNFSDTGRTEAFDDPWVNYGGYGYLPNDHRHQFKLRGTFGLGESWRFGATLFARSGRPINQFGEANPFDGTTYHSFFVCTATCDTTPVYELRERGAGGRTPWLVSLGANVTWTHSFALADVQVKLSAYNLLNQERMTDLDESLISTVPAFANPDYGLGSAYQDPRYAQLTLKVNF